MPVSFKIPSCSLKLFVACIILAAIVLRLFANRYKRGLANIPGPTIAKYSSLWKLHNVWKGNHHQTALDLHCKHGSLVRIGPNHISVGDPSAIPIIYGFNTGFTKTAFFPILSISWNKRPQMNLFSTRDETYHRHQKRIVANAYSVSSLLELESSVDSCTEIFTSQLSKFATKGTPMDLGVWLQYYAFDVIGEITFAKKLGFLEQCRDIDGMMQAIKGMLVYASLCGQVPKMHKFLLGNPLLTLFMPSMESWNQVLQFTLKAVNSVASLKRDGDKINAYQGEGTGGKDMMSRWMAVHRDDPERLSVRDIIVHLSANVFVGAATTGIALRAILNFLMRDPRIMDKVKGEIDVAVRKGRVGNPISYRESLAHLPYMTAVIKEALRLHPSTGLIIEREVPQPGATICGKYIPGGTIVGINAWVVNRNARVFHDPDMFIPERWLESTTEKLMEMEQAIFTFGSGPRACVGKNVSFIEMHKIVPQLLREFEIRLNSSKELEVRNIWFVQQEGMICDLVKR